MRILQAMAGARHGGAELFFTRLVPALAGAGLDQRALVRPEPERLAVLHGAGIRPDTAPFGRRFDLVTRRRFRRLLQDFDPHIVLTWMNRATAACPRSGAAHCARLGGYYNLRYYHHCDYLIANTLDIADYIARSGWPRERVRYLPNFVPDMRMAPADRAALDTPPGVPLILALGRLHRNKGFDVLLAALAKVPGAWLWVAGEGPAGGELTALATRYGVAERVRWLGWRMDVPSLFAAATVLVCPSRVEPLGNVIIEAWMQRRPIVATAAAGPRGLIEDGKSGLLVPIDDADALGRAIKRVLTSLDLAASLAEAGRVEYEANFTEKAVVDQYCAFFHSITRQEAGA